MTLLLLHAVATLLMLGVILVVQLVHYPVYQYVRADDYEAFQALHMRRITWIVAPAMTTELGTAGWIAWAPPAGVPGWAAWTGLGLVLFIWAVTGLVQVPLHRRLTDGFDAAAHRRLVATNWLRRGPGRCGPALRCGWWDRDFRPTDEGKGSLRTAAQPLRIAPFPPSRRPDEPDILNMSKWLT